MGLKTEEIIVGDHKFVVTQWNATKALIMKMKIGKYFASALTVLGAGTGQTFQEMFMKAIPKVLEDNDPEQFVEFIKEVMAGVIVDGKRMDNIKFDIIFSSNIAQVYEVLWFIIKVNYEDFFEYVLTSLTEKSN